MKLHVTLFLILLALCALFATFFLIEEPPNASGVAHPELATMMRGGDGALRHSGTWWLGWLVAVCQVLLFVGLLVLGIRRGHRPIPGQSLFVVGVAAYLLVFSLLMLSYRRFMNAPEEVADRFFLAFPAPTAWMLYGVWTVPLVFVCLYVVFFEDWIYGADEEAAFQRLLAERDADSRESHD